jgi:tetratricopeptide (TPR) repeat protein
VTYPINADPLDIVMPMLLAGRLVEALPYLEALSKQAPDQAQVLYNLGVCYSELGQFDEAIIRLKRAVQLEPQYAHAWVGMGPLITGCARLRPSQRLSARRSRLTPAAPMRGATWAAC